MNKKLLSRMILRSALSVAPALAMFVPTSVSAQTPATATAVLHVDGMHCAVCPITVRAVLRRLEGVSDATVNVDNKTAVVTYDPARVTPERMAQAVSDAGYPARVQH